VLVALLAALQVTRAALPAGPQAYAIVASPGVPVSALSLEEVRRIFLMRKRFWKPGDVVTILLPPAKSQTRAFMLSRIYQLDEPGLRRMILEKIYRAEIDLAPKVVGSDSETVDFVAGSRGLVGLVPAEAAAGSPARVLRVDGKLPGDEGYPLVE
jgi:hypothetical protein